MIISRGNQNRSTKTLPFSQISAFQLNPSVAPRGSAIVIEIFDVIVNIKSLKMENCDHFLLQVQGNDTM